MSMMPPGIAEYGKSIQNSLEEEPKEEPVMKDITPPKKNNETLPDYRKRIKQIGKDNE